MGAIAARGHGGTGPAASSWWTERQGRVLASRITVPTVLYKGKTLSLLPGWLHLSLPIRATFGSRLRDPNPLCSPVARHPPNLDTTWTHWYSDAFPTPTDGASLLLGHLSPGEVLPALSLPGSAASSQCHSGGDRPGDAVPPHCLVGPVWTTHPMHPERANPSPDQPCTQCRSRTAAALEASGTLLMPGQPLSPAGPKAWRSHVQQFWRVLQRRNNLSSLCWHLLQARPFPSKPWLPIPLPSAFPQLALPPGHRATRPAQSRRDAPQVQPHAVTKHRQLVSRRTHHPSVQPAQGAYSSRKLLARGSREEPQRRSL